MCGKTLLPLIVAIEVRTFEDIESSQKKKKIEKDKEKEKDARKIYAYELLEITGLWNGRSLMDTTYSFLALWQMEKNEKWLLEGTSQRKLILCLLFKKYIDT